MSAKSSKPKTKDNLIKVNWLVEEDLDDLNYNRESVWLGSGALIYRGYDQEYRHVDTLKWYQDKRALFYGSFQFAEAYAYREEKANKAQDKTTKGPVYRFWPKGGRWIRLFSLNKQTVQKLIKAFRTQGDLVTVARLIVAYGLVYNLTAGYQLIEEIQKSFNPKDKKITETLINLLQQGLENALINCIENACPYNKNTSTNNDAQLAEDLDGVCRNYCLKSADNLGRRSFYDVDKPLIKSLQDWLEPQGYDGIFAWVDREYSTFGHDIIIFNSQKVLDTDNRDVLNDCPTQDLQDCPLQSERMAIPIKQTVSGQIKTPYTPRGKGRGRGTRGKGTRGRGSRGRGRGTRGTPRGTRGTPRGKWR